LGYAEEAAHEMCPEPDPREVHRDRDSRGSVGDG
jgi:hypothetical protein